MTTPNQPVQPLLDQGWLSNADRPQEGPPAPTLPGALATDHTTEGGPLSAKRAGPPAGGYDAGGPFAAPDTPSEPSEPGRIIDTTYLEGHEAPWPVAGTSQLEPFAPPGPVTQLHARDLGATEATSRNQAPASPGWWARRVGGQSYDRTITYDPTGKIISQAAPMRSSWNKMGQDLPDNVPLWQPSAEPPHYAKLAQQPTHVIPGTPLAPNGSAPEMGFQYPAQAYTPEPPPVPAAPVTVPTVQQVEPGAGWA